MKYMCSDGVIRTIDEIKMLTEKGIKVQIVRRTRTLKRLTDTYPRVTHPGGFTGGGWRET